MKWFTTRERYMSAWIKMIPEDEATGVLKEMYEQAKIEEQKDTPILQVIDYGKPAEEKNFPPRTIFTLIFGFIIFMFLFTYIIVKQNKELQDSAEYMYIKKNLFRWNNSES